MGKIIDKKANLMLKGEILETTKRIKYTHSKSMRNNVVIRLVNELHPFGYEVVEVGGCYVIIEITE